MPLASPALLIKTSGTRPALTRASAARLTAVRSRTSTTATERDTRCAVPSSAARRSRRSARRAQSTRFAPSAAKRRAHASPIPELAPVTRISFPVIRFTRGSPDVGLHAVGPHHRVAGIAPERLPEFRHVGERPVHAPARRRVRLAVHQRARVLITVLSPPHLHPPQEEALLRREAVDEGRAGLPHERPLERGVRDAEAVQVGKILTQGEPTRSEERR